MDQVVIASQTNVALPTGNGGDGDPYLVYEAKTAATNLVPMMGGVVVLASLFALVAAINARYQLSSSVPANQERAANNAFWAWYACMFAVLAIAALLITAHVQGQLGASVLLFSGALILLLAVLMVLLSYTSNQTNAGNYKRASGYATGAIVASMFLIVVAVVLLFTLHYRARASAPSNILRPIQFVTVSKSVGQEAD